MIPMLRRAQGVGGKCPLGTGFSVELVHTLAVEGAHALA